MARNEITMTTELLVPCKKLMNIARDEARAVGPQLRDIYEGSHKLTLPPARTDNAHNSSEERHH